MAGVTNHVQDAGGVAQRHRLNLVQVRTSACFAAHGQEAGVGGAFKGMRPDLWGSTNASLNMISARASVFPPGQVACL